MLSRVGFIDKHKQVYPIYHQEGVNLRAKWSRRHRSAAHRGNGYPSDLEHVVSWFMDMEDRKSKPGDGNTTRRDHTIP